ncbi:MAG: sugar phosphate nucleotidyltransferase [Patescibacteria group bacterium]
MKGIILAGGLGTRLRPLTAVTNKHLLPIYNQPMIYYPLKTLISAGLKEILIVSGPEHSGHFVQLLGDGQAFGVKLAYAVQSEPGGIAQALGLAEDFSAGQPIAAILGDNIYQDDVSQTITSFAAQPQGAHVFLKEVNEPNRFGVAEIEGDKIINIQEKPAEPKTKLAVTGLYLYDSAVFEIIKTLKPSARGELEITDVNNSYIKNGQMGFTVLAGEWTDAGTFDSLLKANVLAAGYRLAR